MYQSKINNGMVDSNKVCPFKENNSIGISCTFLCNTPDEDGMINCAIARLDDSNLKYEHDRAAYEAGKIGDFLPV